MAAGNRPGCGPSTGLAHPPQNNSKADFSKAVDSSEEGYAVRKFNAEFLSFFPPSDKSRQKPGFH